MTQSPPNSPDRSPPPSVTGRRYPTRNRHPPSRFAPVVSH